MKKNLLLFFAIILIGAAGLFLKKAFTHNRYETHNALHPAPKEGDDGEDNDVKRALYFENMHRAAPGTNWRAVETQNKIIAKNEMLQLRASSLNTVQTLETFANGYFTGEWTERGNNNLAGRMMAVDYLPATDKLYTISAGGTLWMGNTDGSNWTILNQDYQFTLSALKVFSKPLGGTRILAAAYNTAKYSDDNGATFSDATGIDFPVAWDGNHITSFVVLNDAAKTVYCLTYGWNESPWEARIFLYRSTDQGATFSKIYTFAHGVEAEISLCVPNNNVNELYALDNKSTSGISTIYSINGSTVSVLNTTSDITTNGSCVLKGYRNGATLVFYVMTENSTIYKSITQGASWTLQNNLPEAAWNQFNISLNDPDKICFGGVNSYRTADGGLHWTLVNNWADYYAAPATKLHADIQQLAYFKKTDNTEFIICNNDGGTYISYVNLITNTNIGLSGLRAGQYYDVLTDPLNPNNIFAGSQDQGFQRNISAISTPGLLNFTQVISGDYGDLVLTKSSAHLWTQYPGGNIYYYDDPLGPVTGTWTMPGQKPEYGWMLPSVNTADDTANEIYMAGGNITGGVGSYLVKVTATSPNTFSSSQFNYNFLANSNNGTSGISAIGVSKLNDEKIYVATEDGSFFYSNDNGTSWAKSVFSGPTPQYLYGSTILPSKVTHNLLWFGGSGYSNPAVYKSADGGQTFTAMNNGLPNTLVHEIVASPNEKLLFAATEAGPYVYVAANNMWYSLRGASTPIQNFWTVEYINSINTVRFGTYGRGILDLKILSVLPVTLSSFEAQKTAGQKVKISWTTESEFNNDYFIIQRSNDAIHFEDIATVPSYGNSNKKQLYSALDNAPHKGENFYRLAQKDKDGKITFSKIVLIDFAEIKPGLTIFPNPAKNILNIRVNGYNENATLQIIDITGRKVKEEKIMLNGNTSVSIDINNLPRGTYNVLLKSKSVNEQKKFVKE